MVYLYGFMEFFTLNFESHSNIYKWPGFRMDKMELNHKYYKNNSKKMLKVSSTLLEEKAEYV